MRYNSKSIHTLIQTAHTPLQTAHFVKMAKTPNVSVGKLHVFVDTQDNIMLDKSRDQLSTGRQQARTTTSRTTTTKTTTTKTKTCSETVFDIKPFWWWIRLIFGSSYRIVFRVSKQVIMGEDTVEIQVQLPESSLKHVEVLARKVADNKVDLVFRINKKFLGTHRHELVIHSLPTTVEKWFPEQSNCPVWQASGGDHSPLARAEPSSRAAGGGVFHRAGHD